MATIYLRSTDGNDADDGSTWALAKATLAAALTAACADAMERPKSWTFEGTINGKAFKFTGNPNY